MILPFQSHSFPRLRGSSQHQHTVRDLKLGETVSKGLKPSKSISLLRIHRPYPFPAVNRYYHHNTAHHSEQKEDLYDRQMNYEFPKAPVVHRYRSHNPISIRGCNWGLW